ncbi:MAG TPA: CoA-binding protein [Spirochaetota bacterium]|nr:CoA-binding protein [Spirochaetota bacterium]
MNLHSLFCPRSIAIVGASDTLFKWGAYIMSNILDGGFTGKVYPVSVSKSIVFGRETYKSVRDIEDKVDLVFITTPAQTVMAVLEDCRDSGVTNVVMVTSGFSETGEDGARMEKEVERFAIENGMHIVGPNTMGIVNTHCSLYATGSIVRPVPGGISIVAQSGNLGNQIMEWAEQEKIGIAKFVGSGNEGVLKVEDYLEYFMDDEDTSVVLMYIEGIDDGKRFMDVASRVTARKPVIALKAGRTQSGSQAAQSHTGAMSGSHVIFESVMKQTGIVIARTPSELLTLSAAFDSFPVPADNRVGIITLGGGWGVVTADECEERDLSIPQLPADVMEKLDKRLPPFWSKANPVDLVGQPDIVLFEESIEYMAASDSFDAIITLGMVGSKQFALRAAEAAMNLGNLSKEEYQKFKDNLDQYQMDFLDKIILITEKYGKPILPVSLAKTDYDEMVHQLKGSKYKLVIYGSPEEAVLCLQKMYHYSRYLAKRRN